jgi:hypothetical protein
VIEIYICEDVQTFGDHLNFVEELLVAGVCLVGCGESALLAEVHVRILGAANLQNVVFEVVQNLLTFNLRTHLIYSFQTATDSKSEFIS